MKALIALEDGRTFPCRSFTGPGEAQGEVVFNTSMSGYQEVLTDPSYRGQMVAMTYPLIGNYGVNPQDVESDRVQVAAFLIREYQPNYSNYRATGSLQAYLQKAGVLGVEEFDTRALTRHIRKAGAMRAFISTECLRPDDCVDRARSFPAMEGRDLVTEVTTIKPYRWQAGKPIFLEEGEPLDTAIWRSSGDTKKVVAFDFGMKYNILRCLERRGLEVLVVPAATSAEAVMALDPDGVFLSNGPGDPEPVTYAIETVRKIVGCKPIFGICLGHQILGLALGGQTYKLKFGHRGGNQPVKNLRTGKVEITSQNHGFAVDSDSLGSDSTMVTHINLNDNTVEGLRHRELPLFSVQYHPEASPGPHDADYLFDEFDAMMNG
jgi:carbamoyl-phosphate synthase small subunit